MGGGFEPGGGLPEEQLAEVGGPLGGRHVAGGEHPGAAQKHAAGEGTAQLVLARCEKAAAGSAPGSCPVTWTA